MADTHDITIDQGADFAEVVEWVDSNDDAIPIASAAMMVRETPDAAGAPILDLTSDPGGGLTIAGGTVTITIPFATSAALTPGRYRYDLEAVSTAGEKKRLIQGWCTVDPECTRADT